MKYKINDKVKIIKVSSGADINTLGCIGTIKDIIDNSYRIHFGNDDYWYYNTKEFISAKYVDTTLYRTLNG